MLALTVSGAHTVSTLDLAPGLFRRGRPLAELSTTESCRRSDL